MNAPMKKPLPFLVAFVVAVGAGFHALAASETTFITDKKEAFLTLSNSAWGEFGISVSASRAWGKEGFKGNMKLMEIPENSPGKITMIVPFVGPSAEAMTLKLTGSASGSTVDLATTLESSSTLPGSYSVILSVPIETARDLTVLANGKPVTTDLNRAGLRSNATNVSLVKTSTGQCILNAVGELGSFRTHFFAGDPDRPLTLWFSPVDKPSESSGSFSFPLQLEFGNP
jgi:hypothetical protein